MGSRGVRVSGPLGSGAATWSATEAHVAQAGLRSQIELLTDLLAQNETGLLITLDEIHQNQISELRELATVVQHAFREERGLAFVAAGLSSAISDVLNDEVLTFLRRADRHHLGAVGREDIERAIRQPVIESGRSVGDDAIAVMVEGTGGYPFLIQLVEAQVWRVHPAEPEISTEDAVHGVANGLRRLGSLVHEPALANASDVDKSFLVAMAKDDGPSRMADIQGRLGVDVNYASQYRLRLIAAELIQSTLHGMSISLCPTCGSISGNRPFRTFSLKNSSDLRICPSRAAYWRTGASRCSRAVLGRGGPEVRALLGCHAPGSTHRCRVGRQDPGC